MNAAALARKGTIRAAKRTPAALAYAAALKEEKSARSRYRTAPVEERTVDGIEFASSAEAQRYAFLNIRLRLDEIRDLQLQPAWQIEIGGKFYTRYTADFSYFDVRLGKTVIEDVKTRGTQGEPSYRLRKKAAELAHGITITEVLA